MSSIFSSVKAEIAKKQGGGQYARCPKMEVVPSALQVSPLCGKFNIFWLHPPVAYFVAYLHSSFKMHFALYVPRPIFPHDKSCLFVFESCAYPLTLKIWNVTLDSVFNEFLLLFPSLLGKQYSSYCFRLCLIKIHLILSCKITCRITYTHKGLFCQSEKTFHGIFQLTVTLTTL